MASKSEIESLLAANESTRNALAAKLGPAQDAAQQAYDTAAFFDPTGKNFSPNFTGSFNGVTYTDPYARWDAARADFDKKKDIRRDIGLEFNALFPVKEQLEQQLTAATDETVTVKDTEGVTNESATDADTAEKYADPNNTPDGDPNPAAVITPGEGEYPVASVDITGNSRLANTPKGAEASKPEPATAKWAGAADLRVILRVPDDYLYGKALGPKNALVEIGGILFPYTPQISYETQAQYGSVNPLHSNYTQYYYKNSTVSPIQIVGKFTVQNQNDGEMWLATQHLLRALTKMRFGKDSNAGSPPPVCRLEGYGDYQLRNVPVAVQSFKFDLPDNVDYMKIKGAFENSLVPTVSTLSLTVIPIYSRREIQNYSVDKFLRGEFTGKGYL